MKDMRTPSARRCWPRGGSVAAVLALVACLTSPAPTDGQSVFQLGDVGGDPDPKVCDSSDFDLPSALSAAYEASGFPGPIQIFATIAALRDGWTPGILMYETPIQIRFTRLIDVTNWNCAAVYSAGWKDALTKDDPLLRAPEHILDSQKNVDVKINESNPRFLCMVHAWASYVEDWVPDAAPALQTVLGSLGFDSLTYGYDLSVVEAFDTITGNPDLNALHVLARDNCYSPKIMGAIVARQMAEYAKRDGFNMYGDLNRDGTPCDFNCRRYTDPTNYQPTMTKGKGVRWKPLLEDDGRGFMTRQQHVTPHIGTLASRAVLSDLDFELRVATKPNYSYNSEILSVVDRLNSTAGDDTKKVMIEFFDNKIAVTFAVISAVACHGASFEQILNFIVGITASEYDATLLAWKEKVEHDLVRPSTWIQDERPEDVFVTYGGPYQGSQSIKGKNFESWVRVMPHSEFVSASACLCQAMKDFTDEWMDQTHGTLAPPGEAGCTFTPGGSISVPVATDETGREAPFLMGSSKTEPGTTPAADVTAVMESMTALRDACGESRLDGGMHFASSVTAAYQLCNGVGTQGAYYSLSLFGDMRDDSPVKSKSGKRLRT